MQVHGSYFVEPTDRLGYSESDDGFPLTLDFGTMHIHLRPKEHIAFIDLMREMLQKVDSRGSEAPPMEFAPEDAEPVVEEDITVVMEEFRA